MMSYTTRLLHQELIDHIQAGRDQENFAQLISNLLTSIWIDSKMWSTR